VFVSNIPCCAGMASKAPTDSCDTDTNAAIFADCCGLDVNLTSVTAGAATAMACVRAVPTLACPATHEVRVSALAAGAAEVIVGFSSVPPSRVVSGSTRSHIRGFRSLATNSVVEAAQCGVPHNCTHCLVLE